MHMPARRACMHMHGAGVRGVCKPRTQTLRTHTRTRTHTHTYTHPNTAAPPPPQDIYFNGKNAKRQDGSILTLRDTCEG